MRMVNRYSHELLKNRIAPVMNIIEKLSQKGVIFLAPQSVYVDPGIDPEKISPETVIYPGTTIVGETTAIGKKCKIGMGGGAHIENMQIGDGASLMQGVYRDSTLLAGVSIRNGAELRDNCLLEEGVDIGHTVGLKQTILFPDAVLGSLINFCDALMCGGKSRQNHSEVGSCMALYNFTPQGDKFAALFGNAADGIFLDCDPIFIGGQTQIVSTVSVGFGSVIAAGSKLNRDIDARKLAVSQKSCGETRDFDAQCIMSPSRKIARTRGYIAQLRTLALWYDSIRIPTAQDNAQKYLCNAARMRIENAIKERQKRLERFAEKLGASLRLHMARGNEKQIADHQKAIAMCAHADNGAFDRLAAQIDFSQIAGALAAALVKGETYPQAVRRLPPDIVSPIKSALRRLTPSDDNAFP